MPARFRLYGRPSCHLCDEMKSNIDKLACNYDYQIEIINIDDDPALQHLYGARVPVLVTGDDMEICEHFLDVPALQDYLSRFDIKCY